MTVISSYKATPLKNGPTSWVKEKTEPHLPRGWTKYVCMKNGRKIPWLVQYKDSDGKKYKSLKAVEDFLSQIILRNNWQNVAPWNDFLKNMVTADSDKNQKDSFKLPNKQVGRPRKVQPNPSQEKPVGQSIPEDKSRSTLEPSSKQSLAPGPSKLPLVSPLHTPTRSLTPPGPPGPHCLKSSPTPPGPPGPPPPGPQSTLQSQSTHVSSTPPAGTQATSPLQSQSKDDSSLSPPGPPSTGQLQSQSAHDSSLSVTEPPSTSQLQSQSTHDSSTSPPGPPATSRPQSPQKQYPCTASEDLMVTSHFRARKPPGPPSPESDNQTPLPADLIKLEPEDYNEEPSEENSLQTPIPLPSTIPMQVGNLKITSVVGDLSDTSGDSNVDVPSGKTNKGNEVSVGDQDSLCESENIQKDIPQCNKVQEEEKVVLKSKVEFSPILGLEQQNKNRQRLTNIEDILNDQQDEIELSFSIDKSEQESKDGHMREESSDMKEETLDLKEESSDMKEESLDMKEERSDIKGESLNLTEESLDIIEESLESSNIVLRGSTVNTHDIKKGDPPSEENTAKAKDESSVSNAVEREVPTALLRKPRTDKRLKWFDGTFYRCNFASGLSDFCGRNFVGRKPFRFHLAQHHGLALKVNDLNGLNGFASKFKEGTYKCKLCFKPVKHDEFGISLHLMKIHKLSIENYTEQFEQGPIKLNICDIKQNGSETPSDAFKNLKRETISSLEFQLKDNQGQIEFLNTSKKAEREKLEECLKQTERLKAEVLDRITIIEKEKETLLQRISEYNEVIEENTNKIMKIESVNKNRVAVLQEKSEDITEKIVKAKSELEALSIVNDSKEKVDFCPISRKITKPDMSAIDADTVVKGVAGKTEKIVSESNVSSVKETKTKFERKSKDEQPAGDGKNALNNMIAVSNKTSSRKKMGESLEVIKKQHSIKSKISMEGKEQKGSALERKIRTLKAISENDVRKKKLLDMQAHVRKDDQMEMESEGNDVFVTRKKNNGFEKGVDKNKYTEKAMEGAKIESYEKSLSTEDKKQAKEPVRNATTTSRLEVVPPQKRGRKKLSEEEKASRKAMRIDNKKLSVKGALANDIIENDFSFSPLKHKKAGKDGGKDKDASNSFKNLQDSLQKSKKKMQQNMGDLDSQKAVRDLSKDFAQAEHRRSPEMKPKVLAKTSAPSQIKSGQVRFQSKTVELGRTSGNNFSKRTLLNNSLNERERRKHVSLGNVEGVVPIKNVSKSGRSLL